MSGPAYEFDPVFQLPPALAQRVGERLAALALRLGRLLQAEDMLRDAEECPESPIREMLRWNDVEAARLHRLDQCRLILRAIKVTIIRGPERPPVVVRAFTNVTREDAHGKPVERGYINTVTAMSDEEARAVLLRQALADIESTAGRYRHLKELRDILQAIDRAKNRFAENRAWQGKASA